MSTGLRGSFFVSLPSVPDSVGGNDGFCAYASSLGLTVTLESPWVARVFGPVDVAVRLWIALSAPPRPARLRVIAFPDALCFD